MRFNAVEASTPEPVLLHPGREAPWPPSLVLAEPRRTLPFPLRLQFAAKRALDTAAAAAGLTLLAMPMLLIAIAIKLDSRGPVLFAQERIGRGGRPFTMYKFRSMVVNAELLRAGLWNETITDSPLFKVRHDPRRTRVGEIMRRFSFDELPQLINILFGQMSLVGPRPALAEEVDHYDAYCAQRLLVPPGLTGLWQVNGRSLCSFDEMMDLDVRYVTNWTLLSDIRIILRTFPVILSGKGAY